jgi:broad specificity phosphatase PhoE
VSTTFYLIRHGEKDVAPGLLSGRSEGVRLTRHGHVQSQRLAERLAAVGFSRIISSPLERAQETARAIARPHGLSVQTSDAITEIDYGSWTNRTTDELADDPRFRRWNSYRSGSRVPGGESMLDVQVRVMRALLDWHEAHRDETIAVVCHGDPIKAAVLSIIGAPLDFYHRLVVEQGSASVVAIADHGPELVRLNASG